MKTLFVLHHIKLYTHIVLGASLKFFDNPNELLERVSKLFENDGYILSSPFLQ